MNELEKYNKLQQIVDDSVALSEQETNRMKQKLKIFLIAQAESELNRIINYTKLLDEIENEYQIRLQNYINNTEDTDKQIMSTLSYAMDVINNSLNRSQNMIEKITNNTEIFNQLVFVDNSVNKNIGVTDSVLADTQSRIKIREAVEKVLATLKQEEDIRVEVTEIQDETHN